MKWEQCKLGAVCEIASGYPFKSAGFTDNPQDVALVKGENLGQGEVLWDISKRWPKSDLDGLSKYRLEPEDVVLAMDRPWVPAGLKFARIRSHHPEAYLVQRVARLRAASNLTQGFLSCIVGSQAFSEYIKNVGRGVGVPHISANEIGEYSFLLPPLPTQLRIAEILSAYDDLIENNQRRMKLLEESARLLYEEWFVRLRFPGHDHTKIIDGIPEGWERKRLDEIAEINAASLKSGFVGRIDYIDISSVSPGSINEVTPYDFADAPGRARRIVRHGDIIWSCVRPNRKSFALVWNPSEGLIASTGFAVLSPRTVLSSFLYYASTTDSFVGFLEKSAKGGAYPAVVSGDFERAMLLVPGAKLLARFHEGIEPIFQQRWVLEQECRRLRAARDLLLPRLMNGEIEV